MNILKKIMFFVAAQRGAMKSYTVLSDIEDALHQHGLCPDTPENIAPTIERNLEAITQLASATGKAMAQAYIDRTVARSVLEDIIEEADSVAKPNGTTRKLRRIASEGLELLTDAGKDSAEAETAEAA